MILKDSWVLTLQIYKIYRLELPGPRDPLSILGILHFTCKESFLDVFWSSGVLFYHAIIPDIKKNMSLHEICPGLNSASKITNTNVTKKPQTCQRVPTRTANFTKTTRITITANIRKDLRGTQHALRTYKKSLRHEEYSGRCHRGPTRTANFTRITKTAKISKWFKKVSNLSQGPKKNCKFYENYENDKNCK